MVLVVFKINKCIEAKCRILDNVSFFRISYYYEEFSLSGMSFYKRFGLIDKLKISKILFTGVYVVPWDYTVPNISMLIKPDIDDYQNIYSHKI